MRSRLLILVGLGVALPAPAAEKPADTFGLTRLHTIHLTVSAKDWKTMQPTKGGFGFGGPTGKAKEEKEKADGAERKARGSFMFDFAYVKGDVEIDGQKIKDVGLRFKGGGSYVSSQRVLKRPFKIDFDHHVEGQTWAGLKKLSLNNNSMDPTAAREALSYAVYRAAGVPAPRTAFAEVSLTVPGVHDKALVGLYTLVEPVDKAFLKEHYGSAKGLLLKPERVGQLEHLGGDWAAYESRYQPKTTASKAAQQRFIDFTRLVHQGDEEFRKQIAGYLDIEKFLRFLATTVTLASMDSFLTIGHNYYIYLDPKTNKFTIIPWDLDHSLGGFFLVGTPEQLTDLSIRQPWVGNHRLIQRLFADEKVYTRYKEHLADVVAKHFTAERLKADLAAVNKVIEPAQTRETAAAKERKEPAGPGFGPPGFNPPAPDLEKFAARRVASITAQLDGKGKGFTPRGFGFGPPPPGGFGPGQFLAKPAMDALDTNKDSKLSRDEALAGVRALFKTCDPDGKGEVDLKQFTAGIDKVLPKPPAPPGGARPPGGFTPPSPAGTFARGVLETAGKDGKVTEKQLLDAAREFFVKNDKDKNGTLDTIELTAALNAMMPRAPFGPPGGPAKRPDGHAN